MAAHRRGPWSQQEDAYLMRLVQSQGALNWVRIAQTLGSRTPKQCRERYHQNLKPNLNHDPITPEEGMQIEALVHEIGKRWAEIARRLHGRSDNAVKNWWNGSQNRRKRLDRRRATHSTPAYDERRYGALSFSRPTLSLNSTLPVPRAMVPSPLSPPYYSHNNSYSFESPLPSPSSTGSPGSEALDTASSFMSDSGSNYTTSPRGVPKNVSSTLDLAPIKAMGDAMPIPLASPMESKLPGVRSVLSAPSSHDPRTRLAPLMGSHLPTAPNSPVVIPQAQLPSPQTTPGSDKDSRMDVAALLG